MGNWKELKVHVQGGCIVGPDSGAMKSAIGTLAKNGYRLSLTYPKWKDVPKRITDELWKEVMDNTARQAHEREVVMDSIPAKWKDFTYRLKRLHFEPNKDNDKQLIHCPNARVDESQWHILVAYWKDELMRVRGLDTSKLDVWMRTQALKDSIVRDESRVVLKFINDRLAQMIEFTEFMKGDSPRYKRCVGK